MKNLTLLLLLLFISVSSFSQDKEDYRDKFAAEIYGKKVDQKDLDRRDNEQYVINYTIKNIDIIVDIVTAKYAISIIKLDEWNTEYKDIKEHAKMLNKKPMLVYMLPKNMETLSEKHRAYRVNAGRVGKIYAMDTDLKIIDLPPLED